MRSKHNKFMRAVFGPETKEDRTRRAEIEAEVRAHQPSTAPADPITRLEEEVIRLRTLVNGFPRTCSWTLPQRDFLGTLWVNVQCLQTALASLEEDLHAFIDRTR